MRDIITWSHVFYYAVFCDDLLSRFLYFAYLMPPPAFIGLYAPAYATACLLWEVSCNADGRLSFLISRDAIFYTSITPTGNLRADNVKNGMPYHSLLAIHDLVFDDILSSRLPYFNVIRHMNACWPVKSLIISILISIWLRAYHVYLPLRHVTYLGQISIKKFIISRYHTIMRTGPKFTAHHSKFLTSYEIKV